MSAEPLTQPEAFDELERRGVVRAEVRYSGGNDEGGVDEITLEFAEGSPRQLDRPQYGRAERVDGAWVYTAREPTPDEVLHRALADPVHKAWGSFAGEFYVHGRCVWDVASRTVRDPAAEAAAAAYDEGVRRAHEDHGPEHFN